MGIRNRVASDMRTNSRNIILMDTSYTYEESERTAVILNLSHKGALISSKFLPPVGDTITLILQSSLLKEPLPLTATVLRSYEVMTDHGLRHRFAVRFGRTPLELMELLSKNIPFKGFIYNN